MTVIAMSRTEIDRMSVLQDLATSRIKIAEAGTLMGLGRRQVFRLAKTYAQRGPAALVSRKRGRPSNRCYAADLRDAASAARHVPLGQGAAATWPKEPYVQGRIDEHPGVALRDLEASRDALSIQRNSTPAKERTAKLPGNRVTFLNGPNRDFPKRRRQCPLLGGSRRADRSTLRSAIDPATDIGGNFG